MAGPPKYREVAKLQARGGSGALISMLNGLITQIGGTVGPAAYGTPVVVNPGGGIGGAAQAAQLVNSRRDSDGVYRGWFDSKGNPVEVFYNPDGNKVITVYDEAKNAIQLRNADGYVPATGQRFAQGTDYVDGPYPAGTDTIPAMLNRGERVLTAEQNRQLGNISNRELVERLMSHRLTIPVLPARLSLPDSRSGALGNADVINALGEVKQAIADKKLLQLNIDNGGIAALMIDQLNQSTYTANRIQF